MKIVIKRIEKEFENETDEGIILELDMGDNLEIEEEERKKLLKLGKYTTCKIITEEDNINKINKIYICKYKNIEQIEKK